MKPKYIIFAGVNGAGKTTLYRTTRIYQNMERVNTDEIVREFGSWRNSHDVMKAGRIAVHKVSRLLENRDSFNQESTLCGKSILNNIQKAKALGYHVEIHYIGVSSPDIAIERVHKRVAEGGHGIPDADVRRRYEQSLENLKKALPFCDFVVLYDNDQECRRFGIYRNGKWIRKSENSPKWLEKIVN